MNLDFVFPPIEFNHADLVEIATAMNKPAVKKYLKKQQQEALRAIGNGLPGTDETDAAYLRRQAQVIGQLSVFEALLGIEPPPEPGSQEQ